MKEGEPTGRKIDLRQYEDLFESTKPSYAHRKTLDFLLTVVDEEVHIIPRKLTHKRKGSFYALQQNIIACYYGTDATLEELGKIYVRKDGLPRSPERIRQIKEKGMRRLWENSSLETRERFPWESIPLGKPTSLGRRMEKSRAQRSPQLRAAMLGILEGRSFGEITANGISSERISTARRFLESINFTGDLPYKRLAGRKKQQFIELLETAQTKEEVEEIFERLSTSSFFYWQIKSEGLPLTILGKVLNLSGYTENKLRKNRFLVVGILDKAGIAVGCLTRQLPNGEILRYYFIRNKDIPKTIDVLCDHPSLDRYR